MPAQTQKGMRVATLSTLEMGDTCAGGGHPVSKKNPVHYGIVWYTTI